MKIVLIILALVLAVWSLRARAAEEPFAEHCYVEHCQRDADGTLWCFNTETSCAAAECLDCEEPIDCGFEEAECAEFRCVTPGQRVAVMRKDAEELEPSPSWYHPGGLQGFGADGGTFDRQGYNSLYRGWWYDVEAE